MKEREKERRVKSRLNSSYVSLRAGNLELRVAFWLGLTGSKRENTSIIVVRAGYLEPLEFRTIVVETNRDRLLPR